MGTSAERNAFNTQLGSDKIGESIAKRQQNNLLSGSQQSDLLGVRGGDFQKHSAIGSGIQAGASLLGGALQAGAVKSAQDKALADSLLEVEENRKRFERQKRLQLRNEQLDWMQQNFAMRLEDNISNINKKMEAFNKINEIHNTMRGNVGAGEQFRDLTTSFMTQGA